MTKHPRAMLPLALLLAVVACSRGAGEPEPRSDLTGVWDLETVDGATLPAPSPEEPNVMLQAITMTLGADGDYALFSRFRPLGQENAAESTIGGTWVAADDALFFYGEPGGPAIVEFGYTLEGERIHMTDDAGHTWVMRRR